MTEAVASELRAYMIFQWFTFVVTLGFLGGLGFTCLSAFKRIQLLRSRRIQPLIQQGTAIARVGAETARTLTEHGKQIFKTTMHTGERVGIRMHTTAGMVKGTVPEAQRIPAEFAATTRDMRGAVEKIEKAAAAAKALRTIAKAFKMVKSATSIVQAASSNGSTSSSNGSTTSSNGSTASSNGGAAVTGPAQPTSQPAAKK